MNEEKVTKTQWYEILKSIIDGSDYENKEAAIEFIDKQIAALNKKAEKAKEKAAINKANGDEFRAEIESLLTNEFQTIEEILNQVNEKREEPVTKAKVTNRLSQLVRVGKAVKEPKKEEVSKATVMTYKFAE